MIAPSDLILNDDGSVYHLNLLPKDIATLIITVGDPDRVPDVSKHFDCVLLKKHKREFVTHTGMIGNKKISVISTGMGPDNIEMAMIELDALVNIDLENRLPKETHSSLQIIRIGTTGSLRKEVHLDSFLVSEFAMGLDNLMEFYFLPQDDFERRYGEALLKRLLAGSLRVFPYCVKASDSLLEIFKENKPENLFYGTTVSAPGFYAPQGRMVRREILAQGFAEVLSNFSFGDYVLANFEMETASIYAMARLLGHEAISLSAVVANRMDETFSKQAKNTIDHLIGFVIQQLKIL